MSTPPTTTGTELKPVSHVVTMENMVLFEPVDEKNIHTDDEGHARRTARRHRCGVQFMSYILDMLQRAYRPNQCRHRAGRPHKGAGVRRRYGHGGRARCDRCE
jgi:hypothetical protein